MFRNRFMDFYRNPDTAKLNRTIIITVGKTNYAYLFENIKNTRIARRGSNVPEISPETRFAFICVQAAPPVRKK